MNTILRSGATLVAGCVLVLATCGWAGPLSANAVTDWNARAGEVAIAGCLSPVFDPFHESRLYAMVHIAIHDAVNAIERRSRSYAYDADAADDTSLDAAVAAAARAVLVAELPGIPVEFAGCVAGAIDLANDFYEAALAEIPAGASKSNGIELGEAAATAIITQRQNDHSIGTYFDFAYEEGVNPGEYRFTTGFPFVLGPEWGQVTPFVLEHAAQFRPPPPYTVSCERPSPKRSAGQCKRYAMDLAEVKSLGADDVTGHTRTPEQTEIALFWLESSPLSWNRLARSLASDAGLDAWQAARLLGQLNMGLADGYIGSLETKYHYRYWRPETAIQLAGEDRNRHTIANVSWAPLAPTPPAPDYDSAHAVQGAVAAEVFRQFFDTDRMSFEVCSLSLPDAENQCGGSTEVLHAFERFSDAAKENGDSRVLNGFHFRNAVDAGLRHGRKIGAAAARTMKPVR